MQESRDEALSTDMLLKLSSPALVVEAGPKEGPAVVLVGRGVWLWKGMVGIEACARAARR